MLSRRVAPVFPVLLSGLIGVFGLALAGCQEQSTAQPTKPAIKIPLEPSTEPVTVYLGDGTDVSGQLKGVTLNTLTLDTDLDPDKETLKVLERKKVQGLILAVPEEQEVAQAITTSPELWIAAGMYVHATRQTLNANIQSVPCESEQIPLLHTQLDRNGTVKNAQLLASSGCKALDQAVVDGFLKTSFQPLPKGYSLELYPMNYYHQPASASTTKESPAAKTEAPSGDPSPQ